MGENLENTSQIFQLTFSIKYEKRSDHALAEP